MTRRSWASRQWIVLKILAGRKVRRLKRRFGKGVK